MYRGVAIVAVAGVVVVLIARYWLAASRLDGFCGSVLTWSGPGCLFRGQNDGGETPVKTLTELRESEKVAFAASPASAQITVLLMSPHRPSRTRLHPSAKTEDLRDGPAVLIGAFNNSWALRLTGQSRFHFARNPAVSMSWIQDNEHPEVTKWSHVMSNPYTDATEDWAIVSRV